MSGLHRAAWPALGAAILFGAIAFGGVLGPLLLMVGLAHTTAATASLFLNLESVLTAVLALMVFRDFLLPVWVCNNESKVDVLRSATDRSL